MTKKQKQNTIGIFIAFLVALIPFIGISRDFWPITVFGDAGYVLLFFLIADAGDEDDMGFWPLIILFSGALIQIAWAIMA